MQIPWSIAEVAYGSYVLRFGKTQSLETLAARGGFSWSEMNLLHPKWRDEVSEIFQLKEQLEACKRAVDDVARQRTSALIELAARKEELIEVRHLARRFSDMAETLRLQITRDKCPEALDDEYGRDECAGPKGHRGGHAWPENVFVSINEVSLDMMTDHSISTELRNNELIDHIWFHYYFDVSQIYPLTDEESAAAKARYDAKNKTP